MTFRIVAIALLFGGCSQSEEKPSKKDTDLQEIGIAPPARLAERE